MCEEHDIDMDVDDPEPEKILATEFKPETTPMKNSSPASTDKELV